jgi:hypothetical protein
LEAIAQPVGKEPDQLTLVAADKPEVVGVRAAAGEQWAFEERPSRPAAFGEVLRVGGRGDPIGGGRHCATL